MTGRTTTAARTASAAAIALAAAAGLAACSGSAQGETAGTAASAVPSSSASSSDSGSGSSSSSSGTASSGASGTWTESGEYQTPGGQESVKVTLTAKDGVVSSVTVVGSGGSPNSQRYQAAFISGVSGEVVGKQLSTLQVGAVSGSSLTGNGFNAAVDKIKSDAA